MPADVIIHTDGASRGNPGPAAAAYIIRDSSGKVLEKRGFYLGETTNNIAEYTALCRALESPAAQKVRTVDIYSDSELMVRQLNGQYKVKKDTLKPLYKECMNALRRYSRYSVNHVRRSGNADADSLANLAIDSRADVGTPAKAENSKKVRLGILISGSGRTMVNMQKEIDAGRLNAEIAVVISSRSAVKGVQRAEELGLPLEIVRRKDFADIDAFSEKLREVLLEHKAELVIQAGWLCLWKIPPEYENRVMNIHPALLPCFGGKGMWGHHVHEAVLKAGCKVSGCTVHFCTNEYDKGPIIIQRCCPVEAEDTPETLAARVFNEECAAYPEAVRLFTQGRIRVEAKKAIIT